jgi:hypothetical protein
MDTRMKGHSGIRKTVLTSTLLAVTLVYGLLLSHPSPKAEEQAAHAFPKDYIGSKDGYSFVLFFTGDVKGNFEPCG